MRFFSRKLYINDKELLETVPKELLEEMQWAKDCDGQEVKFGRVVDKKNNHKFVEFRWTIPVQYRYYLIIKGVSGYRGLFIVTKSPPALFENTVLPQLNKEDKINGVLDLSEGLELFKDDLELKSHLIDSSAQYIYIYNNKTNTWGLCNLKSNEVSLLTNDKQ